MTTQSATTANRARHLRAWIAAAAAAAVLALLGIAIGVYTHPCEYEDGSTNLACHWDANKQGNGKGHDFISVGYGRFVVQLG